MRPVQEMMNQIINAAKHTRVQRQVVTYSRHHCRDIEIGFEDVADEALKEGMYGKNDETISEWLNNKLSGLHVNEDLVTISICELMEELLAFYANECKYKGGFMRLNVDELRDKIWFLSVALNAQEGQSHDET